MKEERKQGGLGQGRLCSALSGGRVMKGAACREGGAVHCQVAGFMETKP